MDNPNTWIDLPVVEAMEYFGGMVVQGLKWATRYAALFGLIGIIWSAFKVMMSRMSIKDLWWDTLFKWIGFTLLITLYPAITISFSKIANDIGMRAGGGKQVIIDGLTVLKQTIKKDLEVQAAWADGMVSDLETNFDNLTLTTEFQNSSSYDDYMNKVADELGAMTFKSKSDKKKALSIVNEYKERNKYKVMFSGLTLSVLEKILIEKDMSGEEGDNLTESYVDLDIWLRDSNGQPSCYISPSALLKVALLSCQIMWEKENVTFNKVSDDIESDEDLGMVKKAFAQLGHSLSRIPNMFMCFWCCIVLVLATIFAEIQYIMTILEYTMIVGIGAIFIPLLLFDGTKDIPKKLIPVFISFMVKMIVITVCLMFVYYLMIENCINTIADDGGMNWTAIGEITFESLLCYVLTQNAPKVAQTILTGQPQLSMGEALAGAATVGATAAGIKQAPHAGAMAAAKSKSKLNDMAGSVKKSNAASKAAKESLGDGASGLKKFAAGAMARGAVAGKDLKDRMHAKFESAGKQGGTGFSMADKVLQQTGLSSGGTGGVGGGAGGSSAYGQTGQGSMEGHRGETLNASSNPNFKTATKTDELTGQQRSMNRKEFMNEKKQQGSGVGEKVGEWLNNHSQQKVDSGQGNNPLPEKLSDDERLS